MGLVEPNDKIKLPLTIDDLGDRAAVHRRLDERIDRVGRQPVLHELVASEANLKLGDLGLLFDHEILHARHVGDRRLHALGRATQLAEVITIELDAHLGLDARQHVADEMGERLFDGDDNPGNLRELLAELLEHPLATATRLRIEAHDDLRDVDAFGMLVEFGASRPSAEVGHAAHPTDSLVHHADNPVRRIERRARREKHVDLNHALVERRQEVAAEPHDDHHAHNDGHGDGNENGHGMAHGDPDCLPCECLENPQHKTVLLVLHEASRGEEPIGKHGGYGQGDQKRCQDRHDVGDAEGREELAFHPPEGKQRHEHQHDEDRAEHDRVSHLAAGLVDHPESRFGFGRVGVLAEPSENVLDVDDRIIHEFTDGDREPAERHRVDRHSEPLEDQARDDDREGYGRERDESRSEVKEKQKQHDHHEDAPVTERLDDVLDRKIDERFLLVELGVHLDVCRQRAAELVEGFRHVIGELPRVGSWLLGDDEDHGRMPVDRRISPLHLRSLRDPRHLRQHNRPLRGWLYDNRLEIADALDAADRTNKQLVVSLVEIPTCGIGVTRLHRQLDVFERDPEAEQEPRIDEHLELLAAASHRHHLGDTGNREESLPHDPVGEGSHLHRRRLVVLAPHADMHDLPHDRGNRGQLRPDALRHPIERDGDFLRDNLPVDVDVGAPLELDIDHRQADAGGASHGLHTSGPIEHTLERKRDERLHFLRRQPGRLGEDRHPRTIQVGKHVDRELPERDPSVDKDDERQHDREQPKAKRTLDDGIQHRQGHSVESAGQRISGCGRREDRCRRRPCSSAPNEAAGPLTSRPARLERVRRRWRSRPVGDRDTRHGRPRGRSGRRWHGRHSSRRRPGRRHRPAGRSDRAIPQQAPRSASAARACIAT